MFDYNVFITVWMGVMGFGVVVLIVIIGAYIGNLLADTWGALFGGFCLGAVAVATWLSWVALLPPMLL